MTHKHHIVPKHAGGSDDDSNIIELSITEHAEAHRILYQMHGRLQDKLAWKMLSGKTDEAEKIRIELATIGFRQFLLDSSRTDQWKQKISTTLHGRKSSEETKIKQSESLRKMYVDRPELRTQLSTYAKLRGNESRERMNNGLAAKMSLARKSSSVWKNSVSNPAYCRKKSLADPRRRAVIVEGNSYHSIREAAKQTGYPYSRLQKMLRDQTDLNFVRFEEFVGADPTTIDR